MTIRVISVSRTVLTTVSVMYNVVRTGRLVINVSRYLSPFYVYVYLRVTMVPLYFPVLQVHLVAMRVGFSLALDKEPGMVRAGGYENVLSRFPGCTSPSSVAAL